MSNRRTNIQLAIIMVCIIITMSTALAANKKKGNKAGDEYNDIKLAGDVKTNIRCLPVSVKIDPDKIVKKYSRRMFGFIYDSHCVSHQQYKFVKIMEGNDFPVVSPDFIEFFRGQEKVKMAFVFVASAGSKTYWKDEIGPISQRPKLPLPCKKIYFGKLELIKATLEIYPKAEFAWDLNIDKGTPETTKQLMEFLNGDETTIWGRKRIEYGIKDPVKIAVWNLDGEYDFSHLQWSPEKYVEEAKKHIKVILEANPEAVISAQSATAPWHKRQKTGWRKWNQTILKELGKNIKYLSFHPYYRGFCPTIITNQYMDLMDEDIKKSPNPDIKIFVSEHAVWPNIRNPKEWYMTRALRGCLGTSEWLNLMLNRSDVTMMNYHNICGGAWRMLNRDKETGKLYATGILDMYKMYLDIPGVNIVKSQALGRYCGLKKNDLAFSTVAITGEDGELYIYLTNFLADTSRQVSFKIKKDCYLLEEITSLSAPTMKSHNTVDKRPIKVTTNKIEKPKKLRHYKVPPKTLVRLKLKSKEHH